MMQCAACGQENREGAKFCKQCGARLSQPEMDAPMAQVTPTDTTTPPSVDEALPAPVVDPSSTISTVEVQGEGSANKPSQTQADALLLEKPASAGQPTADAAAEAVPSPAALLSTVAPVIEPPPAKPKRLATKRKTKKRRPLAKAPRSVQEEEAPKRTRKAVLPPQRPALDIGERIADRYWIIAARQNAVGEISYQVEDHGVCRACGALVTATAEEQYCFDCGAHLLDTTLPWPTLQLRQWPDLPADEVSATSPFLTWNDYHFDQIPAMAAPTSRLAFTRGVQLLVGQRSDVGVMRTDRPDEDSIFALTLSSIYESQAQPTMGLYLVADGMGGHGDGEVASRLAAEAISVYLLQMLILPALQFGPPAAELITHQLDEAIQLANRRIIEQAQVKKNEMGTTVTLAFVVNDMAYIANVGDSRTYLWHEGGLQQISEDHSAVYQMLKRGLLTGDEIYRHPRRNEILRSLGMVAPIKVDQFQTRLAPGNLLLLCCDGLWEMARNEGIEEVLLQGFQDPQLICDELVRRANQAGGEDNISVVVVRSVA